MIMLKIYQAETDEDLKIVKQLFVEYAAGFYCTESV
jgi:hypothetical protein